MTATPGTEQNCVFREQPPAAAALCSPPADFHCRNTALRLQGRDRALLPFSSVHGAKAERNHLYHAACKAGSGFSLPGRARGAAGTEHWGRLAPRAPLPAPVSARGPYQAAATLPVLAGEGTSPNLPSGSCRAKQIARKSDSENRGDEEQGRAASA